VATRSTHEVTEVLQAWSAGDREVLERLTPIVHAELHRIAKRYISRERPGHTLQTTALVNEAYARLIDWKNVRWQNRAHFFGVSAQLMRRILVDFARRRLHLKNVEIRHVAIDEAFIIPTQRDADLVALDEALTALAQIDERKVFPNRYGQNPQTPMLPGQPEVLLPDQDTTFVLSGQTFHRLRTFIEKRHPLNTLNKLSVQIDQVSFEDGTLWTGGDYFRPDPSNPKKYIRVGN